MKAHRRGKQHDWKKGQWKSNDVNHPTESESRLNYIMTRTNSEKSKEKGKDLKESLLEWNKAETGFEEKSGWNGNRVGGLVEGREGWGNGVIRGQQEEGLWGLHVKREPLKYSEYT